MLAHVGLTPSHWQLSHQPNYLLAYLRSEKMMCSQPDAGTRRADPKSLATLSPAQLFISLPKI